MRMTCGSYRARHVGGDDVDLMSVSARFAREEMHVLADATEMRIVVLGDERDPERFCEISSCRRKGRSWNEIQDAREVVTTR